MLTRCATVVHINPSPRYPEIDPLRQGHPPIAVLPVGVVALPERINSEEDQMSDTEFPETPETADEMVVRWAQRDAEYAKRRTPLTADEIAAIIAGRTREAGRLPVPDRARMFAKAKTWDPPVHPEFGSVKDWLE